MLLERGILHRDISLGNIMFDSHGGEGNEGRLIDFDLAKRVGDGRYMVKTPGDFQTVRRVFI
jgi:serine/threonine protein kinase